MHAIQLLQSAVVLLTVLASLGGNVSVALHDQVIAVANQAIAEANAELAATSTPDTAIAPPDVSTPDATTTPDVGTTITAMPPLLDCSLSAESIATPQGSQHALLTWSFPEGAVGTIRQDNVPNDPQHAIRFAPTPGISNLFAVNPLKHDSNLMEPVYSGSIQGGESFTLIVEKDGQTATCHASV